MQPSSRRGTSLFRRLRAPETETRYMWTSVSAVTREGVTALVQVDFSLQVLAEDQPIDDLELRVLDAVENALRHQIASSTVAELPVAGDPTDWLPRDLVTGTLIEHPHVTSSDIEVGVALRNLVAGTTGP